MKMICLYLCPCLLMAALAFGQSKKTTPTGGAASAAAGSKMCNEPFAVSASADGWPEGPVNILFHHENSKAPWAHNPSIHVAGLEAATPAAAHTLVCVEESRVEVGRYDSGEPGYAPSWTITLMRPSDGRAYFMRTGFDGEMPPGIKYNPGAGVGKPPTELFVRWLRLLMDQKLRASRCF